MEKEGEVQKDLKEERRKGRRKKAEGESRQREDRQDDRKLLHSVLGEGEAIVSLKLWRKLGLGPNV